MVLRAEAQQTSAGVTSNGTRILEPRCGRKHIAIAKRKKGVHASAAGIFRGRVKQLNHKEIVIENDFKQLLSILRSHKTKFLRNNRAIEPSDIDLDSSVTIDATESPNGSLLAVNVIVDPQPTKTHLK